MKYNMIKFSLFEVVILEDHYWWDFITIEDCMDKFSFFSVEYVEGKLKFDLFFMRTAFYKLLDIFVGA